MELIRSLAVLAEPPRPETVRLAELLGLPAAPESWEYTQLFIEQLYPYGSVYLGPEGQMGGSARELMAGFWTALGETPPPEPDHLSLLLGLYARLVDLENESPPDSPARAAWRRARTALLWEHLLSWLVLWLPRVESMAGPTYRAWAGLLAEVLDTEARELELPDELPLLLREAPALDTPDRVDGPTFLTQLLAPVRTGLILTRADLTAAAGALGLGLRAGERAYVLPALISQDATGLFAWLAERCETAAAELADPGRPEGPQPVVDLLGFWIDRLRSTGATLAGLASA